MATREQVLVVGGAVAFALCMVLVLGAITGHLTWVR